MSELSYRQLLREREKKRLSDFMNQYIPELDAVPVQAQATPQAMPQATVPSAAEGAVAKLGIVGTAFKTTKEALGQAYTHFTRGAMTVIENSASDASDTAALSGAGEALLGGLSALMALPLGVGAGFKRALETYVPGFEKGVALTEENAAYIRTFLGLPSFLLDPETRKLAFSHSSELTREELAQQRMLVEELYKPMTYGELFENLVAVAIPSLVTRGVGKRAAKKRTTVPPPEPLQVQDATRAADVPRTQSAMTPESIAERIAVVAEELTPAVAEVPLKSAAELALGRTEHFLRLRTSIEVATKRAEEIIREEAATIPELSKLLEEKVAPGAAGKSTPSPIPTEPGAVVKPTPSPIPAEPVEPLAKPLNRGRRAKLPVMPDIPEPGGAGEAGRISINLLARMAVGAAIGGTQGDTPEDRVAFALGGMFVGVVAPRVARRLVSAFRSDPKIAPILDSTNTKMPGFSTLEASTQPQRILKTLAGENKDLVDKLLSLQPDEVLSIDELRLTRQVEMRTWERVQELVDDIVADKPFEAGELKWTFAAARTLNDYIKHTERRLGATGGRGLERVKVNTEQISKLAKEWDPMISEKDMAMALSKLGAIEKVGLAARINFAIPEALTETMYGSMLLGPAIVKNAAGSMPMVPIAILDRSLASLKFWDPTAPAMSEGVMGAVAFWEAAIEQVRMLRSWQALGEQAQRMGATHVEFQPRGFEALADISRESGAPMLAKGFDYMASAAHFGPGIMQRTDGIFKAINMRMAIQWESMQHAARIENLKGDAYWSRVSELVTDYSQLPPEALVRIKQFRDHQTFTRQLENSLLKLAQAGPTNPWANLLYRMMFLPFVRTPVRILEVGAEYTLGINFLAANFYRELKLGGSSASVAQARIASGAIMIGSFMALAMQGYITGRMPSSREEAIAMEHAGRPPLSFWDPLASKHRSYAGMEPLTYFVSMGADLAYAMGQLPEVDAVRLFLTTILVELNDLSIQAFTEALSELADVIKMGRTDSQWEKSLEFIRRRLTVFIPAVAKQTLTGQEQRRVMLTGAFDEDKSPSAPVRRELQALFDEYRKGFGARGGAFGAPPYLKVKRNMFTADKMINDSWPFNPFTTKPAQLAPWASEIKRLNGAGLEPLPDWIGQPQSADIGLQDRPTAPGVRLNTEELDRLEVLMAQVVRDAHGKLTDSLNALVQSATYKRQSDVTRRELIQQRWNGFRKRAELLLLKENESLRKDFQRKRGESMIEQMPIERQAEATRRLQQRFPSPGLAP